MPASAIAVESPAYGRPIRASGTVEPSKRQVAPRCGRQVIVEGLIGSLFVVIKNGLKVSSRGWKGGFGGIESISRYRRMIRGVVRRHRDGESSRGFKGWTSRLSGKYRAVLFDILSQYRESLEYLPESRDGGSVY